LAPLVVVVPPEAEEAPLLLLSVPPVLAVVLPLDEHAANTNTLSRKQGRASAKVD
jgi:hypothetical protein